MLKKCHNNTITKFLYTTNNSFVIMSSHFITIITIIYKHCERLLYLKAESFPIITVNIFLRIFHVKNFEEAGEPLRIKEKEEAISVDVHPIGRTAAEINIVQIKSK